MYSIPIILTGTASLIEEYIEAYRNENSIQKNYIERIVPEKKDFSIGLVRDLKKRMVTFQPQSRLFVLYQFGTARTEAQNAILKTLEEKPVNTHIILITENLEYLLPTIRSRARSVRLDEDLRLDMHPTSLVTEVAEILSSARKPEHLFAGRQFQVSNVDDADNLICAIIAYLRTILTTNTGAVTAIKECLRQRSLMRSNNLNPQLALDSVLLSISKSLFR